MVIAVDLASDAATGSFSILPLTSLVGKVDYEVTANGGVDESVMANFMALPVNAQFAAVMEQPVVAGPLWFGDIVRRGIADRSVCCGGIERRRGTVRAEGRRPH